jgi:hypothetical protein
MMRGKFSHRSTICSPKDLRRQICALRGHCLRRLRLLAPGAGVETRLCVVGFGRRRVIAVTEASQEAPWRSQSPSQIVCNQVPAPYPSTTRPSRFCRIVVRGRNGHYWPSPAHDGRPHRHSVALHRNRAGSGAAASDAEAQFARPTTAKDHVGRHSDIAMTAAPVVPTLQDPTTGNCPPAGLFGASCERRARAGATVSL